MKKTIQLLSILTLIVTSASTQLKAQLNFSAGLEIAFPLEDGVGLGAGVSGGAEYELNDNSGVTAQLGFIKLSVDGPSSSASMIPFQFGYKYYFDSRGSGFYAHGQMGFHTFRQSIEVLTTNFQGFTPIIVTEKRTFSNTDFSLAFGGGYSINEYVDLGFRYNIIIANGGNFNYLGIRGAYNF